MRLVLLAHGSPDARHAQTIAAVADAITQRGVDCAPAFLDHNAPHIGDMARSGDVVVPMLLTDGFHRVSDIPALAAVVSACEFTEPLGADAAFISGLEARIGQAGATDKDAVVLAWAGSTRESARRDVDVLARAWGKASGRAIITAAPHEVESRVVAMRGARGSVVVSTFLVADGVLGDRIAAAGIRGGAAHVGAALGDRAEVVEVVLARAFGVDSARTHLENSLVDSGTSGVSRSF
jgi:sirohydrochlorin ferrochelatase